MLTAERLRECLLYNPDTGEFRWLVDRGSNAREGTGAGAINTDGYRVITLCGREYRAHRLAWLYMTGEWPADEVDHRNLIRDDNRWDNLREATPAQNKCNSSRRRHNAAGVKGVYRSRRCGRWRAVIVVHGRKIHLGYFDHINDAAAAYAEAAVQYHGEFARVS
jgi:hypothetical protein